MGQKMLLPWMSERRLLSHNVSHAHESSTMTWSCAQARNVRRDNLDMRRPVWVSAVAAPSAHEVLICVRIKLQAPRAIDARDCACSMAWRFHAVDATLAFSG